MNEQPDRQLSFLRELVAEHATIAGDVFEVGTDTWAIHGSIPVDGDVLLAEYDTQDEAKQALGKLAVPDPGTAVHRSAHPEPLR